MSKQPGSPDFVEALCNRVTAAGLKACKEEGVLGEVKASVIMDGTYSFTKEGEWVIDLDVGADIPDQVPVDADVGTEFKKEREKAGKGRISVTYAVTVRTKGVMPQ